MEEPQSSYSTWSNSFASDTEWHLVAQGSRLGAPAGGHGIVESILERALRDGLLCHAYLLEGPAGLGKASYATSLAQALNCTQHAEPTLPPCRACPDCKQIEEGVHPDVIWLSPQGTSLKIDQIRAVRRETSFSPSRGRYRIVILESSHRMTVEAANSMLTVLEESPGHTVFLLLTENPDALPSTILSRCHRLPFRPLSRVLVEDFLVCEQDIDPELARVWAEISGGNPGRAVLLSQDQEYSEMRDFIMSLLENLPEASDRSIADWAQSLADLKQDEHVLEILELLLRDLMILALPAGGGLVNRDYAKRLSVVASSIFPAALMEAFGRVNDTRRLFGANVNRVLAWEVLLLNLQFNLGSESRG